MPGQPSSTRRGNLPTPLTDLIGRDELLDQIVELVRSHRLVTLTGVGGVGKTRLALEVGAALTEPFPDGVWFIELASVGTSEEVTAAIATVMGIAPNGDVPLIDTVAEAMAGRRTLIVLDNCEHVVEGSVDAIEQILDGSDTVRILVTSRESLSVAGEQPISVPPLALEGGVTSAAVALFVERAQAVQPAFSLDRLERADAVKEICRTLDGLALGIELAAARMGSMTPTDVLDRLGNRFRLLAGPDDSPERQRTLWHTVAWSYELLDEDERQVLDHASVFSGGFVAGALTAVLDGIDEFDVLEVLDSLVRKSLVIADLTGERARYQLLETIRQFGAEQLSASGSTETARDRHARYFARAAAERWEVWNGPGWRPSVDWTASELANLRSAVRWSADRGDLDVAVDVAAHAALMGVTGELFETVGWAEDLLDAATAADVSRLPRLYTAAGYACFTGRAGVAVEHAHAATEMEADQRYDPCEPGLSMFAEGLAQVYSGHLDRYVELMGQVAALPGSARAYGLPGFIDGLQASGRVDEALELGDEAVAAARDLGNPFWIAYSLWTYGSVLAKADPPQALTVWTEGLAYVREQGVSFMEGFIARDAASLELADADPDESLALFDLAIESFHRTGNIAQLTITLASATRLFERLDQLDRACVLCAAISRQPGSLHHVPDLPDLADRLASKLGPAKFAACCRAGKAMDLNESAHFAREQIQLTRGTMASRQDQPGGLSAREIEVLHLVAEGLTTRTIAERLYIAPKTADHHIQHIYTKIGVSSRAAATRWAIAEGLITI